MNLYSIVITVLFGDDTTMIVTGHSISDISDALTKALVSAHEWLYIVVSGLQSNTGKTKCLLIHSNRPVHR